jgi:hypothetical protein
MSRSSNLKKQLAFVGNGRERADCFAHPQARRFVHNLDDVIVELLGYPVDWIDGRRRAA